MQKKIRFVLSTIATLASVSTFAGPGPCEQIVQTCKTAGFVAGQMKLGYGLWDDCVNPIMQHVQTVPGATKPLPAVDSNLVSACSAKKPKFGTGKVGSLKGANAGGSTTPATPSAH